MLYIYIHLFSDQPYFGIEDRCSRFTLTKEDATFSDVIESANVVDIVACSKLCNKYVQCCMFAIRQNFAGYTCKLGNHSQSILSDPGSMLYSRN